MVFHSILLVFIIAFLFFLVTDLLRLAIGYRIEIDTSNVSLKESDFKIELAHYLEIKLLKEKNETG
ncbi:hypothetical protein V7122_25480 [Bacillus sp. JJ1532]|uniref:hypothetical protein n=1 Tax=unclassified Bacillus (in: firmicutes) TaxID=185979 RepID=UPI0030007AFF